MGIRREGQVSLRKEPGGSASRRPNTCHIYSLVEMTSQGISLVVQWLRLHASSAGGLGSIPGQGTKIPHAV